MDRQIAVVKAGLLASLTALLVSGCAVVRNDAPIYPRHGSIKDQAVKHSVSKHTRAHQVAKASTRFRVTRVALKSAPAPAHVLADKVRVIAPKIPVEKPEPKATLKPESKATLKPEPKATDRSEPPKIAAARDLMQPAPGQPAAENPAIVQVPTPTLTNPQPRVTTEARRAEAPAVQPANPVPTLRTPETKASIVQPQVVQPEIVQPQVVLPQVLRPVDQPPAAQPQVALAPIQPKTAPATQPKSGVVTPQAQPPQPPMLPPMLPKVAAPATAELQRVVIQRSIGHLKSGNIANARAVLTDANRLNDSPEVLTALANTFDPITLQAYPRLVGQADAQRALGLYKQAAAQGHEPAQEALKALEAFVTRRQ